MREREKQEVRKSLSNDNRFGMMSDVLELVASYSNRINNQ